MFEAVGVAVVSACILQIIYEKVGGQNTVADYTEENKAFRQEKEQEAKSYTEKNRTISRKRKCGT